MAKLRTWAEFEKRGLWHAEQQLVEACKAGEECKLGDGTRPDGPSEDRNIRADLLRYLILGGCEKCRTDELGVLLAGGYIQGQLDISFGRARGPTGLFDCRFEESLEAFQSRLEALVLSSSAFPGLNAQGAEVTGDVFFRGAEAEGAVSLSGAKIRGQLDCEKAEFCNANGHGLDVESAEVTGGVLLREVEAEGEVSFLGAKIDGQLACEKAKFRNFNGFALNVQGAEMTGDVFIKNVEAVGEARFSGAKINGQLNCEGATFRNARGHALNAEGAEVKGHVFLSGAEAEGQVRFASAKIGGQLICIGATFRNAKDFALHAQGLRVDGGLLWREVEIEAGSSYFVSAHVSDLVDDLESWPKGGRVILDGFTYDRITGGAFLDPPNRLEWLRRGTRWNGTLFPQPYTQLARVYREMGHDGAARTVLMERERLIREEERKDARFDPAPAFANGSPIKPGIGCKLVWSDIRFLWSSVWDRTLRWLAGYGYAPARSFRGFLGLLLIAWVMAWSAWEEGSFAPNSDVVLVSEDWKDIAADHDNPAAAWSAAGAPGMDWDSFNAFGYAADLVVPILDLGQTEAWAPSKDRGDWGKALWWGRWVLSSLGWVVTALGAAAITGIIQPKRE